MKLKGKGMACFFYGMGNTGKPNPSGAFVELMQDGSANVLCGAADIGQGLNTVFSQIAAEELGISLSKINIITADSGTTPEAGVTSACRQTYISGKAVFLAAEDARNKLFKEASRMLKIGIEKLAAGNDHIYIKSFPDKKVSIAEAVSSCWHNGEIVTGSGNFNPPIVALDDETGQGAPYATYSYGTLVAEVEVDTETGEVSLIKLTASQDAGRAINPMNIEGQIHGGISMGVGFFMSEDLKLNQGCIMNPNFREYLLPTAFDMPQMETAIVEAAEPTGPFGAKGVGEPSNVPVASAINNAIYDATGKRATEMPCTAERMFYLLST